MSLVGPTSEDQRKIHSEVNQIVHQRFLLTTVAITLFGAGTAWMLPDQTPTLGTPMADFAFTFALILSLLLFSLFFFSHQLKNIQRVFTTYLVETKSSGWEADWAKYRTRPYSIHTIPHALIFLLLNILTGSLPFLLAYSYSLHVNYTPIACVSVGVTVATTVLIYLMSFHGLFDIEARSAERWKQLNGGSSLPIATKEGRQL